MIYSNTFTSESVCSGHPDKICDRISDSIVDEVLSQSPTGRAAIETLVCQNHVVIAGEVKIIKPVNYKRIAREVIKDLGYTKEAFHFSHQSPIEVFIHAQSVEIAAGVDTAGAGDQGMMFGYACEETKHLMPMPIELAHQLAMEIDKKRETSVLPYLRPDGKTQVTVGYKNGKPVGVETVVVAVPHAETVKLSEVFSDVFFFVNEMLQKYGFSITKKQLIVNGTGIWHIGGPASDTGVTGRKIVVDTYGGYARIGGGCFSGKDPTKVDRSGAYAARYLAKNIVAHQLAERAEVRLAYFIGAKKPIMQEVETFNTEKKSKIVIQSFMKKILDTSVDGILTTLQLRRPIYTNTSAYGHFGREEFPWEQIAKV